MAKIPTKVMVIGLDCAQPHLIEKYVKEGALPTFKKLLESGTLATHALAPYPTVTPPNWAVIATGACDGTHGLTDFHNHTPGATLGNESITQNWDRDRILAETVWEAAEKAGKKCIVVTYPGSAPSRMKKGITVGGNGFHVGETRKGLPSLNAQYILCEDSIISTDLYPHGFRGEFADADGWEGMEDLGSAPLEMEVKMPFPRAQKKLAPATWWVLLPGEDGEYKKATLATGKSADKVLCTLTPGQWSDHLETDVTMEDGTVERVFFRCKLIKLAEDSSEFKMIIGALVPVNGDWIDPLGKREGVDITKGAIHAAGGLVMGLLGSIDYDTYVEMNDNLSTWNAEVAVSLMQHNEWDLFYMHSHPIDWMYHLVLTDMVSEDAEKRERAWDVHKRIYQVEDRMLARVLSQADKDTLVVLVSDHGATPDGVVFDPYKALGPAGLAYMAEGKAMESESNVLALSTHLPDYTRSKAVPQREIYVYVNLKGRDPGGIVEPEDYEKVQREICDALLTYVDPQTGKRPVALALPKKDARLLGLYGDRIGDVVYALYPEFGSQHGHMLPTAEAGPGKLGPLMLFSGPNIKKNNKMERTCWLWDLVPTICYLLCIPAPEQTEGAVLYQAMRDPFFKDKELEKLREGLKRMEAAMSRDSREPWDHHDCA